MPTILNWPERGEWGLANPKSPVGHNNSGFYHKADPPFAELIVYFKSKTGTIRQWKTTTPINNIQLRQTADGPKFSASYAIGSDKGQFEATVFDKYELEIEFTGTAVTSVNAHPTAIIGGDTDVASLSRQDKLQEAIRRALPLLPEEVGREVQAMFTPAAIGIMATMAALWAASHLAVVGEVADLALLITGGVLLGKAAWDVGKDLTEFMTQAVGADTEDDLNEAARHFAAAIVKGGVLLAGTLLMSKKAGRGKQQAEAPIRRGELPTNRNMVPASRIPPPSRSPLVAQGDQPQLAGLSQEVSQVVRAVLNRLRRADLTGREIDCCAGSEALDNVSGNRGIVRESTSGASTPAGVSDHTMWEIGNEFVDTRPGWWRRLFATDPAARARVNSVGVPRLAERLESGAVLTRAEHRLYQSGFSVPRSPRFDGRPLPRPGSSGNQGSCASASAY
jgi:hypothetical protein